MTFNPKIKSEDYLRFGILEYENGLLENSWEYVSAAVLADPDIENRKHAYKSYIVRIIQKKFGDNTNVAKFLENHRSGNQLPESRL